MLSLEMSSLEARITALFSKPPEGGYAPEHFELFDEFKRALNAGSVRAASPEEGRWQVNAWVKQGILIGFRMGALRDFSIDVNFRYFDKATYPLRRLTIDDGVRVVPGGSSIRDGVHLGRVVTCM